MEMVKNIIAFIALGFFLLIIVSISKYSTADIDALEKTRYTVLDKEYVEGCKRVQEARAKNGMTMDQYWDQGCKRVLGR